MLIDVALVILFLSLFFLLILGFRDCQSLVDYFNNEIAFLEIEIDEINDRIDELEKDIGGNFV